MSFVGCLEIHVNPETSETYDSEPSPSAEQTEELKKEGPVKASWDTRLSMFQKLIIVKSFMEEKVKSKYTEICIHTKATRICKIVYFGPYCVIWMLAWRGDDAEMDLPNGSLDLYGEEG